MNVKTLLVAGTIVLGSVAVAAAGGSGKIGRAHV